MTNHNMAREGYDGGVALCLMLALFMLAKQARGTTHGHIKPVSATTLVTAMFEMGSLANPKNSPEDYRRWSATFLSRVSTPVYLFTDSTETAAYVSSVRPSNWTIIIHVIDSLWNVEPIHPWIQKYKGEMLKRAPEGQSAQVSSVWNAKAWFAEFVSERNPFGSKNFFWVDVGAFREEVPVGMYHSWPDEKWVSKIFADDRKDKLLMSMIRRGYLYSSHPITDGPVESRVDFIQGAIFGGSKEALQKYARRFYDLHDQFILRDLFDGREENLMKLIPLWYKTDLLLIDVEACGSELECGSMWFTFISWMAAQGDKLPTCRTPPPLAWNVDMATWGEAWNDTEP